MHGLLDELSPVTVEPVKLHRLFDLAPPDAVVVLEDCYGEQVFNVSEFSYDKEANVLHLTWHPREAKDV